MSNALTTLVPVLDGSNYQVWACQMKAYLQSQDLWAITIGTYPYPATPVPQGWVATPDEPQPVPTPEQLVAQAVWFKESNHALGNIMLHLTPPIQEHATA